MSKEVSKTETTITHIESHDIESVKDHYQLFEQLKREIMVVDVDYGLIPGVKKKTLWKAGAEKLVRFFNLYPSEIELTHREVNTENGLVNFEYKVFLLNVSGVVVSSGIGSCNSYEEKYLYRWVDTPKPDDTTVKTMKSRRTGRIRKFGNNWHWQQRELKTPHELIALENTIMKMAKKRAFVDAVLMAIGGSQSFTQDVEKGSEITHEQDQLIEKYESELNKSQKKTNELWRELKEVVNFGLFMVENFGDKVNLETLLDMCEISSKSELIFKEFSRINEKFKK